MKTIVLMAILLLSGTSFAGEIYSWTDKNGNLCFSDSPPAYGSFKKQEVVDEIDKVIDKRKEIEKKPISEGDKLEEKIKNEIDYQKRAKSIRDYQAMREELDRLKEKYEAKLRDLTDRYHSVGYDRRNFSRDSDDLRREYRTEEKRIKNLYGYY